MPTPEEIMTIVKKLKPHANGPNYGELINLELDKLRVKDKMLYYSKEEANNLRIRSLIKAWAVNGKINIVVDSTDCDMTHAVNLYDAPATYESYIEFRDRIYSDAEGPTSVYLIPPEDVEGFRPYQEDLALRAFEDGHPHIIYK